MIVKIKKIRPNITAPTDLKQFLKELSNGALTNEEIDKYFISRYFVDSNEELKTNVTNSSKRYLGSLFKVSNAIQFLGEAVTKHVKGVTNSLIGLGTMIATNEDGRTSLAEFVTGLGGAKSIVDYRMVENTIFKGQTIYDSFASGIQIIEDSTVNGSIQLNLKVNYTSYQNAQIAAVNYMKDILFIRSLVDPYDEVGLPEFNKVEVNFNVTNETSDLTNAYYNTVFKDCISLGAHPGVTDIYIIQKYYNEIKSNDNVYDKTCSSYLNGFLNAPEKTYNTLINMHGYIIESELKKNKEQKYDNYKWLIQSENEIISFLNKCQINIDEYYIKIIDNQLHHAVSSVFLYSYYVKPDNIMHFFALSVKEKYRGALYQRYSDSLWYSNIPHSIGIEANRRNIKFSSVDNNGVLSISKEGLSVLAKWCAESQRNDFDTFDISNLFLAVDLNEDEGVNEIEIYSIKNKVLSYPDNDVINYTNYNSLNDIGEDFIYGIEKDSDINDALNYFASSYGDYLFGELKDVDQRKELLYDRFMSKNSYPIILASSNNNDNLKFIQSKLYKEWGLTYETPFDTSGINLEVTKNKNSVLKVMNALGKEVIKTIDQTVSNFVLNSPSPVDLEFYPVFRAYDDRHVKSKPITYKMFVATSVSTVSSKESFIVREGDFFNNMLIPNIVEYNISFVPAMKNTFETHVFEEFNISKNTVPNINVNLAETQTQLSSIADALKGTILDAKTSSNENTASIPQVIPQTKHLHNVNGDLDKKCNVNLGESLEKSENILKNIFVPEYTPKLEYTALRQIPTPHYLGAVTSNHFVGRAFDLRFNNANTPITAFINKDDDYIVSRDDGNRNFWNLYLQVDDDKLLNDDFSKKYTTNKVENVFFKSDFEKYNKGEKGTTVKNENKSYVNLTKIFTESGLNRIGTVSPPKNSEDFENVAEFWHFEVKGNKDNFYADVVDMYGKDRVLEACNTNFMYVGTNKVEVLQKKYWDVNEISKC